VSHDPPLLRIAALAALLALAAACNAPAPTPTSSIASPYQTAKSVQQTMVAAATPVPALTLIGFGNWDLVTFNGHALIEGTSINLTFTDKFLTGKMSCNS